MTEGIPGVPATNPSNASSAAQPPSYLGPELKIRGQINGDEDLKIDGKIEGPISLGNHRLTLGPSAQVSGNLNSREIVVFGNVKGNLLAEDRVDVRRDAFVVGDLKASRIAIEDGAQVKGAIEINWASSPTGPDPKGDLAQAVKSFRMKRAATSEK